MDEDSHEDFFTGLRNALFLLFAAVGLALGAALILRDPEDAAVVAKLVEEASERKAVRPAEICIVQFEAGARWLGQRPAYTCASPATELSSDVLTLPVSK